MGVTEQPDYLLSTIYRFFSSFASNRPFLVHRRIWDLHENNSETTLALEINRSVWCKCRFSSTPDQFSHNVQFNAFYHLYKQEMAGPYHLCLNTTLHDIRDQWHNVTLIGSTLLQSLHHT